MPPIKMQVAFGADTALPRDRFVITPTFNATGAFTGTDVQALCDDLADGLVAWISAGGTAAREVDVTGYHLEGPPPHDPLGHAVRNAGTFPASGTPRELALCLSFYSQRNAPRTRGRLYLPVPVILSGGVSGARPGLTITQQAAALVPLLTGLGGADIDWSIWSRTDQTPRAVTHWFIDDEWDVQRRRGLRSSYRTTGTTSELTTVP